MWTSLHRGFVLTGPYKAFKTRIQRGGVTHNKWFNFVKFKYIYFINGLMLVDYTFKLKDPHRHIS